MSRALNECEIAADTQSALQIKQLPEKKRAAFKSHHNIQSRIGKEAHKKTEDVFTSVRLAGSKQFTSTKNVAPEARACMVKSSYSGRSCAERRYIGSLGAGES